MKRKVWIGIAGLLILSFLVWGVIQVFFVYRPTVKFECADEVPPYPNTVIISYSTIGERIINSINPQKYDGLFWRDLCSSDSTLKVPDPLIIIKPKKDNNGIKKFEVSTFFHEARSVENCSYIMNWEIRKDFLFPRELSGIPVPDIENLISRVRIGSYQGRKFAQASFKSFLAADIWATDMIKWFEEGNMRKWVEDWNGEWDREENTKRNLEELDKIKEKLLKN